MSDITIKRFNSISWDIHYPKTTISQVINLSTALANIQNDVDNKAKKENSVYFVEGNTTGTNGQWTGNIVGITELYEGLSIVYKIGISGASPTNLNINNYGNVVCRRNTGSLTTHLPIGTTVLLTYAIVGGTPYWIWADYNTAESYTFRWNGAGLIAGESVTRYKIVMMAPDGRFHPIVIGDSTGTNNKTVNTTPFVVGGLILAYWSTTIITANGILGSTLIYSALAMGTNASYNFNVQSGWLSNRPLYLKGTINANGLFVLAGAGTISGDYMTQTLPTIEDGFVYIRIGSMYTTTNSLRFDTASNKEILEFRNGRLQQYLTEDVARLNDLENKANLDSWSLISQSAILGGSETTSRFISAARLKYAFDNVKAATAGHADEATDADRANEANTLLTPRNINGTAFNGSANITTTIWGTARNLTIGSTGKSVNGSGNVAWSLAEIGAQASLSGFGLNVASLVTPTQNTYLKHTTAGAVTTLTAGDVLTDIGGVPKSRQINGKALTGNISLNSGDVGAEPSFSKNTGFNKDFGSTVGTVAQGNDSRFAPVLSTSNNGSNRRIGISTGNILDIPNASPSIAGFMSAEDKTALDSIANAGGMGSGWSLVRDSSTFRSMGAGTTEGSVTLNESVVSGGVYAVEVNGHSSLTTYSPKIVIFTAQREGTTNSTAVYGHTGYLDFNSSNSPRAYYFNPSFSGTTMYFWQKYFATHTTTGTTTNTYTLWVRRIWKLVV
ncbi:MAG: hypothetical protein ACNA7U_01230 [Candidatus Izemoplasmataceae bacterium]